MVNFDCSEEDLQTVISIVQRYNAKREQLRLEPVDKTNTEMDIVACHCNGCPLRLKDLLEADDFNLAHDIVGISNHIDRKTGQIKGGFMPRFAA